MNGSSHKANLKVWGSPEDNKVVIYIDKRAYDAIHRHGTANTKREVVGILLGNVSEDSTGKYRVDIVGTVKSESAPGNQTQAQFTHQVWLELVESAQREYPKDKVVGWYHTHPGFGAFLSDDDVNSHKIAFSHPWHVAAVCDPIKGELCFFGWDGSELKAIRGFYTYEVPVKKPELLPHPEKLVPSPSWMPASLIPVLILFMAALVTIVVLLTRLPSSQKENSQLPFEDFPVAAFSFYNEDKGELYHYLIRENGETWSKAEGSNKSEPWKKGIESVPIKLGEITEQPITETRKAGNSVGTLEMRAEDEKGTLWILIAYITNTGALDWQQPKPIATTPAETSTSLSITPQYLFFGAIEEESIPLQMSFTGSGNLSWHISYKPDWTKVDKESGDGNATINVTVDRSGLEPKDYTDKIIFTYDDDTKTKEVHAHMTVAATVPAMPIFVITSIEEQDQDNTIKKGEDVSVWVQNIGDGSGTVEVSVNFEATHWDIMEQERQAQQKEIAPGQKEKFEFKLIPKKSGQWFPLTFKVKNLIAGEEYDYQTGFKQP